MSKLSVSEVNQTFQPVTRPRSTSLAGVLQVILEKRLQHITTLSTVDARLAAWNVFEEIPDPRTETDYAWLFEQTQQFLLSEVRMMLQSPISPRPCLDADQTEAQEIVFEQLLSIEGMILTKTAILSRRLDVEPILSRLIPLTRMKEKFAQAIEQHAMYQILLDGIASARDQANELRSQLHDPAIGLDEHRQVLASLLDICDVLGEQLDALPSINSILPLESGYELLVKDIQKLQMLQTV